MARSIKHAELEGYQASGTGGEVKLTHTYTTEDNETAEYTIKFDAHKLAQVIAVIKVATRDALKADSSDEFTVKARAPRSPNGTNKAKKK